MNEKKKLYIMIGIAIGIIVLVIGIYIFQEIKMKKLLQQIDEKMQAEEVEIFYLSRPTCHFCILLNPITETLKKEYQLTYNEINTDNYSSSQIKRILNKFGTDPNNFGTPYIAITKNGKVIGELNGYADENVVFELFQKHGIIPEEASLAFQYINYDTFKNMWNGTDKSLVMIGETGEKSVLARNALKALITAYHLNISYMDVSETYSREANSTEKYNEFLKMLGYQTQPNYPILMIVQNGTIVAQTNEVDTESFKTFLKTNGYME